MTAMPQPIVIINNEVDPIATVVTIKFGDYLGDLLDTVAALKNLKLNINRAKFDMEGNKNKFFITDEKNGEKIFSSERLEEIRMTIINNLMLYHPESLDELSSFFHAKRASEPLSKLGARGAPSVNTEMSLYRDQQDIRTILEITTADRPGLLVDIVKILKDVSTQPSPMSESGRGYRSATAEPIRNRGQKNLKVKTSEGSKRENEQEKLQLDLQNKTNKVCFSL